MWRALLAGLAASAAALVVLLLVSKSALFWNGDPGLTLSSPGIPFVVEVASVTPHGPAARAGVHAGDRVDLRALSFADRVLMVAQLPVANRPITLVVQRNGRDVPLTVVPRAEPIHWDGWIGELVLLWMAGFSALIAWRRPALPEARLLSVALSCYVAGDVLQFLTTPSPVLNLVFSAINYGGVLGGISLAALVAFNARFGRPLSPLRRAVDGIAYAAAALLALYGIVSALALGTNWLDPVSLYLGTWGTAIICGAQILVVVSGGCAVAAARGFERQRVTWAVVSIGTLLIAAVVEILVNQFVPTYDMHVATQAAVNVLALVAPIGLTYSVFSRRLLDIGFALNRAAVFSVVSIVIVGAFMTVEWAVGGWLVGANHVTSTAVAIGLAIALGFSVRFVHHRVERAVDQVFFRKRYRQEKALLAFAHEAAFITEPDALLLRAVSEIAEHAETNSVSVLVPATGAFVTVHSTDASAPAVSENDPAIVAMRASRSPVDLHRYATQLAGEYAFPMVARGRVVGVIVCGPKRSGDAYAPDETAALAKVAHGVGAAYDQLTAATGGDVHEAIADLRAQVAALRGDMTELLGALRLPERS